MQRYFIDSKQITNNIVTITGEDVHHIKNVMRMVPGDKVYVCDEVHAYLCEILEIADVVTLEIKEEILSNPELNINVTVAHGLVRREKMEEVIRRLVELGGVSYIPVNMARSVVKVKELNLTRLEKIVKEASEQSQRNKLMKLSQVISFKELVKITKDYDIVLFAHALYRDNINLYKSISDKKYKNILVIIGPEGGFDDKEVETLMNLENVRGISLGKRILRTETAPLYIMSVLSFLGEQYEN